MELHGLARNHDPVRQIGRSGRRRGLGPGVLGAIGAGRARLRDRRLDLDGGLRPQPGRSSDCASSCPVPRPGPPASRGAVGPPAGRLPAAPPAGSPLPWRRRLDRIRPDPWRKRKDSRSTRRASPAPTVPGETRPRAPRPRARWRAGCCWLREAPCGNSPPERRRVRTVRSPDLGTRRSRQLPAQSKRRFSAATSELEMGGFGLYIGHLESRPGAAPSQRASHRGGAPRSSVSSIDDGSNRCQ